ncbi:MAG: hypothetical protein B7Z80_18480 [Rhodospirillales bacterium 20-64-7]|nr:MAG: hypothetical protein B7Z80_18480 [Rhodospirillales bacterium 20-64-7]HQT76898.1 septal ring lytic transglycosylase RlpA family protein [Rhodopila sp.]
MKQYFAAACVAASAILSLAPQTAYARHHTAYTKHHTAYAKHNRVSHTRVRPTARDSSSPWLQQTGVASYYGPAHQGRPTASGRRFDQQELTAAHPWLPFGTRVKVTRADTGKSVIVVITDRLPSNTRIVDLSLAAARELGMIRRGLAEVTLTPT